MNAFPVYIVSGGKGLSGEQLVRTALAQFGPVDAPIIVVPHVQRTDQLEQVVQQAVASGGLIVHTLVNTNLRAALVNLARKHQVVAVDVMGDLLLHLSQMLGQMPVGQPGLYRRLHEDYFKQIEAIEFTVEHDDGRKPDELHLAEIVLVGVSRVSKTPLSIYLSVRGWKVANIPLVQDMPAPPQLFEIDRRRVVGLTIDPGQLATYRRRRQSKLGVSKKWAYSEPDDVRQEMRLARQVFYQGGFAMLDVTDKPIEESADDVIALVTRRLTEEN